MIHPIIKAFLECYLNWVIAGHPETKMFRNRLGLCGLLVQFTREMVTSERNELSNILSFMFKADGLDIDFPFNNGNLNDYYYESGIGKAHESSKRVEWVKSKLPDWEPEKNMNEFIAWLSHYPNTWSKRHEISDLWRSGLYGRNHHGQRFELFDVRGRIDS